LENPAFEVIERRNGRQRLWVHGWPLCVL
jgi:hypothetical protein